MCNIDDDLLRSKIALNGYNSKTIAEKIGITPMTIYAILKNKNLPSLSVMRLLQKELNLSPQDVHDIFFTK